MTTPADVEEKVAQPMKKLMNTNVRVAIRCNYLIFPVEGWDLLATLAKAGYAILGPLPSRPPRGVRIGYAGGLARKAENIIDGNDERGFLGVSGPSFASAMRGLEELLQLIKTNMGIDLTEKSRFYEIIGHLDIETDKSPLERLGRAMGNEEISKTFNSIFGYSPSYFSLRLVPQGKVPNQEEWFDITIEPDLIKAMSRYNVSVVFRSADKSKVQAFGQDLEARILSLIDTIEKD